MRKLTLVAAFGLLAASCASSSGVVPMGPDTFMISKQAGSGFSGLGSLKADAYREAGEYCIKGGKSARVTASRESQPPYVFGNFPRAEIEFMCLSPGDPELTRPKMTPTSDTVIEIRK